MSFTSEIVGLAYQLLALDCLLTGLRPKNRFYRFPGFPERRKIIGLITEENEREMLTVEYRLLEQGIAVDWEPRHIASPPRTIDPRAEAIRDQLSKAFLKELESTSLKRELDVRLLQDPVDKACEVLFRHTCTQLSLQARFLASAELPL